MFFKEKLMENRNQIIQDLVTYLKFPSISTDPIYKSSVLDCQQWLCEQLKNIGFEVEVWQTSKHPVIFATFFCKNHNAPTVLFYNHYDVQPVDPVELWTHDPFEPFIDDQGTIWARGAQDNKGQSWAVIQALKHKILTNSLDCHVKLLIEGEEECGSRGLSEILESHQEALKADIAYIVDFEVPSLNQLAVTLGMRGLVTFDLSLTGSNTDLHSGSHGGIAYNPNRALVELLSSLKDSSGKILVDGFYDHMIEISDEQKKAIDFSFDREGYKNTFACSPNGGETTFSPLESNWIRPTLEINGICGGYTGSGFKTVIPAQAQAKISCRLVMGQDPFDIFKKIEKHLIKNCPEDIKMHFEMHPGKGKALFCSDKNPGAIAAQNAYQKIFKQPIGFILTGASIPIADLLASNCKCPLVFMGLGLPTDKIHAPNEHFSIDRLFSLIEVIGQLLDELKTSIHDSKPTDSSQ